MSVSRREYATDLLNDCVAAVDELELPPSDRGIVIAALILTDAVNGLRKAILQYQGSHHAKANRNDRPSGY